MKTNYPSFYVSRHLNFLNFLLLFILATALGSSGNTVRAQMVVEDKNNRRQVERMVFLHWKKFRPAWYFWLLHGRYRKKDRRIILQLAPALAALEGISKEAGQEREDIKAVHDFKVVRQANTVAESHFYLYYEKVFSRLDEGYDRLYSLCTGYRVTRNDMSRFERERAMLNEYLKAVREGNIIKGESAGAMREIQKGYEKLLSAMHATINAYQLKGKVSQIKMYP